MEESGGDPKVSVLPEVIVLIGASRDIWDVSDLSAEIHSGSLRRPKLSQ